VVVVDLPKGEKNESERNRGGKGGREVQWVADGLSRLGMKETACEESSITAPPELRKKEREKTVKIQGENVAPGGMGNCGETGQTFPYGTRKRRSKVSGEPCSRIREIRKLL